MPEVKQTIIDMSLNASGVRDTARSLHICPNTVLRELKKKETALESVNTCPEGGCQGLFTLVQDALARC